MLKSFISRCNCAFDKTNVCVCYTTLDRRFYPRSTCRCIHTQPLLVKLFYIIHGDYPWWMQDAI